MGSPGAAAASDPAVEVAETKLILGEFAGAAEAALAALRTSSGGKAGAKTKAEAMDAGRTRLLMVLLQSFYHGKRWQEGQEALRDVCPDTNALPVDVLVLWSLLAAESGDVAAACEVAENYWQTHFENSRTGATKDASVVARLYALELLARAASRVEDANAWLRARRSKVPTSQFHALTAALESAQTSSRPAAPRGLPASNASTPFLPPQARAVPQQGAPAAAASTTGQGLGAWEVGQKIWAGVASAMGGALKYARAQLSAAAGREVSTVEVGVALVVAAAIAAAAARERSRLGRSVRVLGRSVRSAATSAIPMRPLPGR